MNLDDFDEHSDLMVRRRAWFSREEPEPLYRYMLEILWDASLPMLLVIMLNPSTASHLENDPTIARVQKRATMRGFGGVIILNAFAWRETDRLKMLKVADPVGPLNDAYIRHQLKQATIRGWTVFVGWGNEGGHRGRSAEIAAMMADTGVQPVCLKIAANGQPYHPLYIGYDQPFIPWSPA